jgi:ribonucleoside-triphosphate reductase
VACAGSNEQWYETVERVVNGTYNMQKQWIENHSLGWNPQKAQFSAQEMYVATLLSLDIVLCTMGITALLGAHAVPMNRYDRIFHMKFLPPGRGLWAMGSPLTEQRGLYAALNNCAFVSTEGMKTDPVKPFVFLMDASMLGVGKSSL